MTPVADMGRATVENPAHGRSSSVPSVFLQDHAVLEVGGDWLRDLKAAAAESDKGRARLLMHHSPEDAVQEMVIAFSHGAVLPPHRTIGRSESVHLIEGQANIVFFDEQGAVEQVVELEPAASGGSFMYRLTPEHGLHTLLPLTPFVVVHETIPGPFSPDATVFPAWAPGEGAAARAFVEDALAQHVERGTKD